MTKKNPSCGPTNVRRKKPMQEEIFTEPKMKKITASELENIYLKHQNHRKPDIKDLASSHSLVQCSKHASATAQQSSSMSVAASTYDQLPEKDRQSRIHRRNRSVINEKRSEISLHVEMNDTVEAFVNQKLVDGRKRKDGAGQQSKHFLDALKVLNSNKDLFIKLLQDPNSLLVKHIQDLKESQALQGNAKPVANDEFFEKTNYSSKCKGPTSHKMKSSDRCSAKDIVSSQLLDEIVVLKPNLASLSNLENEAGHMKNTRHAHFYFGNIKRKLSQAMKATKKKQQRMAIEGKSGYSPFDHLSCERTNGFGQKTTAENSPRKIISDIGFTKSSLDVKTIYESFQSKDSKFGLKADLTCKNDENLNHRGQNGSNPCAESRNPFPMVLGKDNKDSFSRKHDIDTTRRMLNLPEYDLLPKISPGQDWKHQYVAAQTSSSACRYCQMVTETNWRLQKSKESRYLAQKKQNVETLSWTDNIKPAKQLELCGINTKVDPSPCSNKDNANPKESMGSRKENEFLNHTEGKDCINLPSETNTSGIDNASSSESNDTAKMLKEEVCWHGTEIVSKEEGLLVENQPPTTSLEFSLQSPVGIKRFGDSDVSKDIPEQPSPVSVLEQTFADSDQTVALDGTQPDESYMAPLQTNLDEYSSAPVLGSCMDSSKSSVPNEHGSRYEVIKAVLKVHGLSSDEIPRASTMLDELLDMSICNRMRLWPGQLENDHKLLVDLTEEALLHINQSCMKSYPWLSFMTRNICPTTLEKNKIHEVKKLVEWYLQQQSQTLEQLVVKDLQKDAAWMDLRVDAEDVVIEIVGGILEELIIEMLS